MTKVNLKIIIRLGDGKQQQFTLSGNIENPEIDIQQVALKIEQAINSGTRYRAHIDVIE